MRPRRPWLAAVAAIAAWVAAACGGPAPTAVPSGPIACGEEAPGLGGNLNAQARACFWEAYEQHRPAEFKVTITTIEGDPIPMTYRVLADGTVEVTIDSTADKFGSGKVSVYDCPELIRVDTPVLSDPIQFEMGEACVERNET